MSKAITTWNDAAEVLGLSYVTLWRRRKEYGCTFEPPFKDEAEVWAWWRGLKPPAPPPKSKPPSGARVVDRPHNGRQKARQLLAKMG